jgi:hypothetical protein
MAREDVPRGETPGGEVHAAEGPHRGNGEGYWMTHDRLSPFILLIPAIASAAGATA